MKVKVVCLNLWLGGILFEQILDFLLAEQPDVLLVQEVYNSSNSSLDKRFRSVEVLTQEAGFPYYSFAATNIAVLNEGSVEVGNAIFSRFPITEANTTFYDIPFGEVKNYEEPGGDYSQTPRNLQRAVIQTNNTELNIFNTQGIWDKDSEDNERRLKMSNTIIAQVKDKKNVILGGDFNLMPHTQSILNIEQSLKNIFRNQAKTTFNLRQKNNPILANVVVDMMFASPELNVVDSSVPDVDISDHLPLVATFEIK